MIDLVGIVESYVHSSEGQAKIKKKVKDAIRNGETVGGFSLGSLDSAAQALSNEIAQSVPHALGGTYVADVSIEEEDDGWKIVIDIYDDDLFRPSLQPSQYGGVDNIYSLFIRGYDYRPWSGPVGIWHGKTTFSLSCRESYPFVEMAVSSWISRYGSQYNIVDWDINPKYRAGK